MPLDLVRKIGRIPWRPWMGWLGIPLLAAIAGWWLEIDFLFRAGATPLALLGVFGLSLYTGYRTGLFINKHLLKRSEDFGNRLAVACGGFFFLFLPRLGAFLANTYLDTDFELHSLQVHFLWACLGGAVFFFVYPWAKEK